MGFQPKSPILKWILNPQESDAIKHEENIPQQRHKLAVCLYRDKIYLYGGASKTRAYKDLYCFDLVLCTWTILPNNGDAPPSLQGHSMLAFKNTLYVFGGNFCYGGTKAEVPLWKYDLLQQQWKRLSADNSSQAFPCSRREHSAIQHSGHMLIFGGFVDLKGSSSELWDFDLDTEKWRNLHSASLDDQGPGSRHAHTAVIYDNAMWICGGMSDLQPRPDIWKWHLGVRQWQRVKPKTYGPTELSGHTAVVANGYMIMYGGFELQGCIWLFHFESLTWIKQSCRGNAPNPSVYHSALLYLPLSLSQKDSLSRPKSEQPNPTKQANGQIHPQHKQESGTQPYLSQGRYVRSGKAGNNRVIPSNRMTTNNGKGEIVSKTNKSNLVNKINAGDSDSFETHGGKIDVQKGIESYMKFAEELMRSNSREESNTVAYHRQSSGAAQTIRMRRFKRHANQISCSCESLAQEYSHQDALLFRQRSKTFGDVSVTSLSGLDNPAYLNSTGNSSELNTSVRSRELSYSSDVINHYIPTMENTSNVGRKMRKLSKGKSMDSIPGYRPLAVYNELRNASKLDTTTSILRSTSVDSILETSPTFKQKGSKDNTKKTSTSQELLLSAEVPLPGTTDDVQEFDETQIRCLKRDDLIVEDIEEIELDTLITSRSIEVQGHRNDSDLDLSRSNLSRSRQSVTNIFAENVEQRSNGIQGVRNLYLDQEETATDFGASVPLKTKNPSRQLKPETVELTVMNENTQRELQAPNACTDTETTKKYCGTKNCNVSSDNEEHFQNRSSDSEIMHTYANKAYMNTSIDSKSGHVSTDTISDHLNSTQAFEQNEPQTIRNKTQDKCQETSFINPSLKQRNIQTDMKSFEGSIGHFGRSKKEYVMIILGGKQENTSFVTLPISMSHLSISF